MNTLVAGVVNPRRLYTEVGVPQRRLPSLREGLDVELTVETNPGRLFAGRLEAIYPTVDPGEGTVKVRVAVVDPQRMLVPGIYVDARIVLEVRERALLIPKRARLFERDFSVVFAVRDGKAVKIRVPVGLQTAEELEVLEPHGGGNGAAPSAAGLVLRDDDLVVIRGQTKLKDGARVEIQEEEPETKPEVADDGKASEPVPEPDSKG